MTTAAPAVGATVLNGKLEGILEEINRQLVGHGIAIRKESIMDATLVQSMARPRKEIIIATDGSGGEVFYENGSQPGLEITKRQGADPDAMRLKKGGRVTYGHRVHTVTDGDGYLIGATA